MTRISERLVVQRVDDRMVMMDDSSGDEFVFPVADTEHVVRALVYLATADIEAAAAIVMPPLVE